MATRSEGQVALDDWRQLKTDQEDHAFTSEASMRKYAKFLRLGGVSLSKETVDDAIMWLQQHSDELPGELYDRDGLPRFAKAEYPSSWGQHHGDDSRSGTNEFNGLKEMGDMREGMGKNTADAVLQDTTGMYYTAEQDCNRTIGSYFRDVVRSIPCPEERAAVRALGPTVPAIRNLIRLRRGASYQRHAEAQAKRLRWQGMEEYDAVAKADDHLRAGVKLAAAESNANPLPPLDRVCALLSYDSETGVFTRLTSAGRAKAGDVARPSSDGRLGIDGALYYASRLAVLLMTGSDPASRTIAFRNGDSTDLRWDNLTVEQYTVRTASTPHINNRVVDEDVFEARLRVSGKDVSIGTYRTPTQAEAAKRLFVRSLEMGL